VSDFSLHLRAIRAEKGDVRRRPRIGDILLEHGLVEQDELDRAIEVQQNKGGRLGQILLDEGIVSPVALLRSLASQFGVELVDLEQEKIDPDAVSVLSPALARRHRAMPIRWDGDRLVVAMANPADLVAIDDIRAVVGSQIVPVMAETGQLHDAISRWSRDEVTSAPPPRIETAREKGDVETAHIRFVDAVLGRAIGERASDIHLEPAAEGLRVRFRVDGVMHDVFTAPRGTEAGVVSRLKVLAEMDISERRLPQDGRCSHAVDGKTVDLRVATVPTIHGEAAVIRILDSRADIARLDDLGFSPGNLKLFRDAITRPWGAVLVTGPTGSGKTTTLYGALRELNDPARNVITVEDPVEITMEGIKQVQVNPRAGLTFASALRSFLRADPDVVLIGEIRDVETATIASEAALTGHLVLSTIHTNDACSTPLRLLEMGVEPFLVASAVQAVVAQRLARRLCERCKIAYEPSEAELLDLGWDRDRLLDGSTPTLHRANGCASCNETGYRGRLAVHEVMVVDDDLAAGLGRRIPVDEVRKLAMAQGMRTLREDGLLKVATGLTSVEELHRVLA
jgi:type IV pilus assembly protein PilB